MKKLCVIFIVLLLLGFAGGWMWWQRGTSAVNPQDKIQKMFIIQPGEGLNSIANRLKEEGLITDAMIFSFIVRKEGYEKKIQAGDFRLSPSMKPQQIAKTLTTGAIDIWITVPEGKRAEEIADILKENIPTYDDSWRRELVLREGYLFPDTYLIPKDATIDTVISIMTNNFEQRYAQATEGKSSNRSQKEIVILASLIEREGRHDEDRFLIASVLENRLDIGMALQIDATVQYALGYQPQQKSWWKQGVTLNDLKVNSPYNTYAHPGLPPAPIANPGSEALEAAANPSESDYLYYITDKNGINRYAKTYEEHNVNIKKYGL